jgi:hypothetical protein
LTQIVKLFHFLFDFPKLIPFVEWVIKKPLLKYSLYALRLVNHFYKAKSGFSREDYFSRLQIPEKYIQDMELVAAEKLQKIMKSYAPDVEIIPEALYVVQIDIMLISGNREDVQLYLMWLAGNEGMEQEIVRTYQPIRSNSRLRHREVISDYAPYNATKLRIGYCVNNPTEDPDIVTEVLIQMFHYADIKILKKEERLVESSKDQIVGT